jgi:hypothetical protein
MNSCHQTLTALTLPFPLPALREQALVFCISLLRGLQILAPFSRIRPSLPSLPFSISPSPSSRAAVRSGPPHLSAARQRATHIPDRNLRPTECGLWPTMATETHPSQPTTTIGRASTTKRSSIILSGTLPGLLTSILWIVTTTAAVAVRHHTGSNEHYGI